LSDVVEVEAGRQTITGWIAEVVQPPDVAGILVLPSMAERELVELSEPVDKECTRGGVLRCRAAERRPPAALVPVQERGDRNVLEDAHHAGSGGNRAAGQLVVSPTLQEILHFEA